MSLLLRYAVCITEQLFFFPIQRTTPDLTLYVCAFSSTVPVCVCERVCELIIAAPLVFSGGSSRISLRLSPGWDHRAGIVLACGDPTEMGECPSFSSSFFSSFTSHFLVSYVSLSASSSPVCSSRSEHFHRCWVFPFHFLVSLTHSPCPTHLSTIPPPVSLYPSIPSCVLFSSSVHLPRPFSSPSRH